MLVMRPGVAASDTGDATMRELGASLREVHDRVRAEPDHYGYLGEHEPMPPQPTWREAFATMWHLLHDDLENCAGYPGDELAFLYLDVHPAQRVHGDLAHPVYLAQVL